MTERFCEGEEFISLLSVRLAQRVGGRQITHVRLIMLSYTSFCFRTWTICQGGGLTNPYHVAGSVNVTVLSVDTGTLLD